MSVCPGGGRLELLLSVLVGSATSPPDSVAWPLAPLPMVAVVLGSVFPLAPVPASADISTASVGRDVLAEVSLFSCGAATGSNCTVDLRAARTRYLGAALWHGGVRLECIRVALAV